MIVYAVICRAKDAIVLAEHSSDSLMSGNAPQVVIALMEHLRDNPNLIQDNDMKTFVHNNAEAEDDFFQDFMNVCAMQTEIQDASVDEHYFHLYLKDGVTYCCISDDPDTRDQKVNFAFLQQIQQEFSKQNRFRIISMANAYGMDKKFAPNFRSALHYYNINHSTLRQDDKVTAMMAQVEDMKDVMGRSIQLSMRRAANLERMLQKTDEMEADIQVFYKKAKVIKKRKKKQYYRVYAAMAAMFFFFVYLMMAAACGFKLECGNSPDE